MSKHVDEILESIDRALEAPPVTIEQALDWAVQHGTMTIKEAEECADAYNRTFHGDTLASPLEPVVDWPDDAA